MQTSGPYEEPVPLKKYSIVNHKEGKANEYLINFNQSKNLSKLEL